MDFGHKLETAREIYQKGEIEADAKTAYFDQV